MTPRASTPSRTVVLAAVDDTDSADDVIRLAAGLGRTLPGSEQKSELHYVYVIPYAASLTAEDLGIERARAVMEETATRARQQFGERVVGHLANGTPWREIVQLAANIDADLLVVGSHRKSAVRRLVLGSVSEAVVRHASCPVLVARPKGHEADVPEIEPPCPDCLETQAASAGQTLWCARHAHHRKRVQGHVHYELPPSFSTGAMLIRPD